MAWTANVTDSDQDWVYLEFLEDGVRKFADKYPLPPDGSDGVARIARDVIARLSTQAAATPIAIGPVTPARDPEPPPPPPDPTPEQIAEQEFLAKVERLQRLRTVLGPANPDVAALEAEIALELKAHPEYEDSL